MSKNDKLGSILDGKTPELNSDPIEGQTVPRKNVKENVSEEIAEAEVSPISEAAALTEILAQIKAEREAFAKQVTDANKELAKRAEEIEASKAEVSLATKAFNQKVSDFEESGFKQSKQAEPKTRNLRQKRIAAIKEKLASEPKVKMIIPLEGNEKIGKAYKTVTINGFKQVFPKGKFVEMSETQANIITSGQAALYDASRVDKQETNEIINIDLDKNEKAKDALI